jgi:hypothetical protein
MEGRNRINTYPSYNVYILVDSWNSYDSRPRVITYIRKGAKAQQVRPWTSRDILWILCNKVNVVNIYRPPDKPNSQVTSLLLNWTPPRHCILVGDFNVRHPLWEPGAPGRYNSSFEIVNWTEKNGFTYVGKAGVPTHSAGHMGISVGSVAIYKTIYLHTE